MVKTNHRVTKQGESSVALPYVPPLISTKALFQPLKGKAEANSKTNNVLLKVNNFSLGEGIRVDMIKFPYMANLPSISHKTISLGLELIVLTTPSLFPLMLQTLIS